MQVKKCCCIELKTGIIILGCLELTYEIFNIIGSIEKLTNLEDYVQKYGDYTDVMKSALRPLISFMIGESIIGILMNICLIWGTIKNSHLMLIPWLLIKGISYVVTAIFILIFSVVLLNWKDPAIGAILLIVGFVSMILLTYFWICVFSLYRRFKDDERLKSTIENEEANDRFINSSAPVENDRPPSYNTLYNNQVKEI